MPLDPGQTRNPRVVRDYALEDQLGSSRSIMRAVEVTSLLLACPCTDAHYMAHLLAGGYKYDGRLYEIKLACRSFIHVSIFMPPKTSSKLGKHPFDRLRRCVGTI